MQKIASNSLFTTGYQLFNKTKRIIILAAVALLVAAPFAVLNQTASAEQVTNRSLSISNAVAGQTGVTYTFTFTPATSSPIQSMFLETCNTPVNTCNAPTGIDLAGTPALTSGFAGTPTDVTKDTTTSTPVDCTSSSNLCINWTDTTSQTTSTPLVVTVTGVTNQTSSSTCSSSANCTFFVRIFTYSDTGYTDGVDSGNVASSTTQPLSVNSIVQEELSFCVGTVNGASSTVEAYNYALPTCSTLSGSSLNLGTLSYADVSVSPVPTAQPTNGDLNNAVAELSTNAYNGTDISYVAIQQSGTNHQGAMRVPGATCASGSSFTDQCINSVGTTAAALTAGTEDFGMTIPGINCSNAPTITGYSCTRTAHNLVVNSQYDCNSADLTSSFSTTDAGGQTTGSTACDYAWDESGADDTIASSTAPNGVVPGEAMIVEFAATPEVTTPTGAYSAESNFIATPQY